MSTPASSSEDDVARAAAASGTAGPGTAAAVAAAAATVASPGILLGSSDGHPLGAHPLWDAQRRWYDAHALNAWQTGTLPHWISSNAFLAAKYAALVVAYARDVYTPATVPAQPLYIVELGAGHGKMAHLFLSELELLRDVWPASDCFRYVLTDCAEANVASWLAHPKLQPWLERDMLDVALFDAEADDEMALRRSGTVLSRGSLRQPLVVLSNYVFSALRQEHFRVMGSLKGAQSAEAPLLRARCTVRAEHLRVSRARVAVESAQETGAPGLVASPLSSV